MRSLPAALALSVLLLTACTGSNFGDVPQPTPASQPPLASVGPSSHPGTIALRWLLGTSLPGVNIDTFALGRVRGGAVLESPTRLAFVSPGSSSCPWLPTGLYYLGPNAIRMKMAQHVPPHKNCTDDIAYTTVEVGIDPSLVDVGQELNIQLAKADGKTYVTLEAAGLPQT